MKYTAILANDIIMDKKVSEFNNTLEGQKYIKKFSKIYKQLADAYGNTNEEITNELENKLEKLKKSYRKKLTDFLRNN